jgi:hypothetical protein
MLMMLPGSLKGLGCWSWRFAQAMEALAITSSNPSRP